MPKLYNIFFVALLWLISCAPATEESNGQVKYPQPGHGLAPKQLAEAYCGSCHVFPEPDLLSKSIWDQRVLKDMGRRLGIGTEGYDPFKNRSMFDVFMIRRSGIYPEDTLILKEDWDKIINYYLQEAPDELAPQPPKPELAIGMPGFKVKVFNDLPAEPLSTLVKFDTARSLIYWGSRHGDLMLVHKDGKVERQITLESAPSYLEQDGTKDYVLTMGVMDPSEEFLGKLQLFDNGDEGIEMLSKLQRPVFLSQADLDGDGNADLVVSQFGDQTGKLSWFKNDGDTTFIQNVIKNASGTIKTEIQDFDQDGRLDIMALMGQGNEGISIFYNKGKGRFKENIILRFPPVYGSSSFQLVDFNKDGNLDILYSNGDNSDFTYSLKPYHGVRIFLNDGDYNFTESFFYPMYGVTKTMAGDFDLDGDLDLFAISFMPDFSNERPEGFVYLENLGNLNFKPYSFPEAANGRWLVADAADFDKDGDLDIVLGSLLFKIKAAPKELIDQWSLSNYHMILLENTTR